MWLISLRNILLTLFLLLIPSQLGKHFWPDWSLVLGIRIDYLSPVLYFLDLVWIALIGTDIWINSKLFSFKKILNKNFFIVLLLAVINILVAKNSWVAVYGWLRIVQIILTVFLIIRNKKTIKKILVRIIPVWLIGESFLALSQISKGGSLNGFWWWLGERSFSFNTIGIAQMSVAGQGLIRAYGTFSHPNSLAGFLLVSLLWWWRLKRDVKSKLWWWMVSWLALIGIILTGSRIVWALTLFCLFLFLKNFFKEKKKMFYGGGIVLILVVFTLGLVNFNYPLSNFLGGWDENGLLKRGELNLAAIEMVAKNPLFGVGMKNFLVELPEFQEESQIFWLQPVHNILLLVLAEVGLIGLLVIFYFGWNFFKNKKIFRWQWLILGVIVATGMMDHYWLTLSQNKWLMVLFLGLF